MDIIFIILMPFMALYNSITENNIINKYENAKIKIYEKVIENSLITYSNNI